jgi:cellulose biosynthesis protein BcsQ
MKSVAIFAAKGGVGKSTIAVNLAHAAATGGGRRTLLWDLDSQGAASFLLQSEAPTGPKARAALAGERPLADLVRPTAFPNLHILPADRSLRRLEGDLAEEGRAKLLRRLLKDLADSYDRILIDCPPGLSELSDRIFRAVDLLVMPLVPAPLSARAAQALEEELRRSHAGRPPLLPVWSMADLRRKLHRDTVATRPDWPLIPYSAAIEQMAVRRAPVACYQPAGAPARAFAALWARTEAALLRG